MKNNQKLKVILALLLVMVFDASMASFTVSGGLFSEGVNAKKYSLKSINSYSRKSSSLSLARMNMALKGTVTKGDKSGNFIYENSNESYNFKYKFKVGKFKTPSSNNY